MAANPLDAWTAEQIGHPRLPLARADLLGYQLTQLRATVVWAKQYSPFYRRQLSRFDETSLTALDDLRRLPFTTADDLRRNDPPLLCVSQRDISHVVTLETSGTSGPPKRLFFTSDDQAATLDFFDHGMRLPAKAGDRVLIFFPGERPGSVGDLLAKALERMGATAIPFGWPHDLATAADILRQERPDVVAGAPVPMLAVARQSAASNQRPVRVRSVLLSADHVAESVRNGLKRLWGCDVFEHYGMTEMGLGGGVECPAHDGYHMRENELLIEIIDPASGEPVASGATGEVVFTTLRRRGMPLVRYRTGDMSCLLTAPCACGSPLARLDRITRRTSGGIHLGGAGDLTIGMLDEAIFAIEDVADFEAVFRPGSIPVLKVHVRYVGYGLIEDRLVEAVSVALNGIPLLSRSTDPVFQVEVSRSSGTPSRAGKRAIAVESPN